MPDDAATNKRCFRAGCFSTDVEQCDFSDGSGGQCVSYWCPNHRVMVNEGVYCNRHAGIARALDGNLSGPDLPSVSVRAPALAVWVGEKVDRDLRIVLLAIGSESPGAHLIVKALRRTVDASGNVRWERSWRVQREGMLLASASVGVDERQDTVLLVSVNESNVLRSPVPWIRRRTVSGWQDPVDDEAERADFFSELVDTAVATLLTSPAAASRR